MTLNPLYVKDEFIRYRKDFEIVGLYKNRLEDRVFDTVIEFCRKNSVAFRLEPFSSGVEEDRECVVKLPAFHVYYKEQYMTTFYPEDSVGKVLVGCVAKIKKEIAAGKLSWFRMPTFSLFNARKI